VGKEKNEIQREHGRKCGGAGEGKENELFAKNYNHFT
jgi:hypothetical protein